MSTAEPRKQLQLHLRITRYPEELEVSAMGNHDVNMPFLRMFFALHDVRHRSTLISHYVTWPQDLSHLVPAMKALFETIASSVDADAVFTVAEDRGWTYGRPVRYLVTREGDFTTFALPRDQEENLKGSDHGMYADEFVKVCDYAQMLLTERLLGHFAVEHTKKGTSHFDDVSYRMRTRDEARFIDAVRGSFRLHHGCTDEEALAWVKIDEAT